MIADRHSVFEVIRLTVRCDECPRQVSVYIATGDVDAQLANVGWTVVPSYVEGETIIKHYCQEHS